MDNSVFTQATLKTLLIPELQTFGIECHKVKKVLARKARVGEQIDTITSDGIETSNTAKAGDFVIKNQTEAGEMYIVNATSFDNRYELIEAAENNFSLYKAKGKVFALELTSDFLKKMNLSEEFFFLAPWGERMIAKKSDFLVCPPDYSQIYRIARKEFFETYKIK